MTGAEIIKRPNSNYSSIKEQIRGELQVSYNDWGHLVLRFIDHEDNSDCLIVLTRAATDRVKSFVNEHLNEGKVVNLHVNNLCIDKLDDIPF